MNSINCRSNPVTDKSAIAAALQKHAAAHNFLLNVWVFTNVGNAGDLTLSITVSEKNGGAVRMAASHAATNRCIKAASVSMSSSKRAESASSAALVIYQSTLYLSLSLYSILAPLLSDDFPSAVQLCLHGFFRQVHAPRDFLNGEAVVIKRPDY